MINIELINKIFKNSYIEINTNHNEALNVFENYINKSKKYIPILLNFDAHSDVYINSKIYNASIANWVNFCFKRHKITELYWIMPDYISKNPEYKRIYDYSKFTKGPLINLENSNSQQLFFNNKTNELITQTKLKQINKKCKLFNMPNIENKLTDLIPVNIYILTISDLNILNGKEVLLSIDADYFCNSGFDTIERINNNNITDEELNNDINYFLKEIYESKINPLAVSLTHSPIYIQKRHKENIQNFFNAIKNAGIN